uniref:Thiol-transferase Tc52 n=1 Tax=Ganoderma boninense TaxID=34458 RepID=A0A5K1JXE6_9APHY
MSDKRITLYSAQESPFPHRVVIALEEGKIPYDNIVFELIKKPDWYKEVYPAAEVPYLVYGGPKLEPGDAPSADLPQLGESVLILEFLADAFPSAKLLPTDPFQRAKARIFYRAVDEKYMQAFGGFFFHQAPKETLYDALGHMQGMLPPAGGFAVGEWSIADAAFLPILLRTLVVLELNPAMSQFAPGVPAEVLATLKEAPRFARMRKYLEENLARSGVKKSWDPVAVKAKMGRRFEFMLVQAQKQQQQ